MEPDRHTHKHTYAADSSRLREKEREDKNVLGAVPVSFRVWHLYYEWLLSLLTLRLTTIEF